MGSINRGRIEASIIKIASTRAFEVHLATEIVCKREATCRFNFTVMGPVSRLNHARCAFNARLNRLQQKARLSATAVSVPKGTGRSEHCACPAAIVNPMRRILTKTHEAERNSCLLQRQHEHLVCARS